MKVHIVKNREWLSFITRMSRWNEYSTTKVPLIFTPALFMILVYPLDPLESSMRFGSAVLFTALYLAFGYALNDYADREIDRIAGKINLIGNLPKPVAFLFLFLILASSIIVLIPFLHLPAVALCAFLAYAAAAAYSLWPIRLKERGVLGLLASALAQRVCPGLVLFAIYQHWTLDTVIFLSLYSIIGMRWILIHQLLDEASDRRAGVKTFVHLRGSSITRTLMEKIVFPLELLLLLVLIGLVSAASPGAFFLYGLLLGEVMLRALLHQYGKYPFSLDQYEEIPLAVFYFLLMPIFIALSGSFRQPYLSGILIFILFWQWGYLASEGIRFFRLFRLVWKRNA
jgi:4-hydroxybenzoate polyprenyltransferase